MRKSVRHQEVTEFVVDARVGKEKLVQQGDAQSNDDQEEKHNHEDFTSCQPSGKSFEMKKKAFRGTRNQHCGEQEGERKQKGHVWLGEPDVGGGIHQLW